MIQVTVPIFFYFDEISKIRPLELKNTYFLAIFKKEAKIMFFLALAAIFLRFRQNKKNLEQ